MYFRISLIKCTFYSKISVFDLNVLFIECVSWNFRCILYSSVIAYHIYSTCTHFPPSEYNNETRKCLCTLHSKTSNDHTLRLTKICETDTFCNGNNDTHTLYVILNSTTYNDFNLRYLISGKAMK